VTPGTRELQEPLREPPQSGLSFAVWLQRLGPVRLIEQTPMFQRALPELA
jgi:hypothetical protein